MVGTTDAEKILYGITPARRQAAEQPLTLGQAIPPDTHTLQTEDGHVSTVLGSYTTCYLSEYGEAGEDGNQWCGAYGWLTRGRFPVVWQNHKSDRVNLGGWKSAAALAATGLSSLTRPYHQAAFRVTYNAQGKHDGQIILKLVLDDLPEASERFLYTGVPAAVEALSPYSGEWIFSPELYTATNYDLAYVLPEQKQFLGFARTDGDRDDLVKMLAENRHFHCLK